MGALDAADHIQHRCRQRTVCPEPFIKSSEIVRPGQVAVEQEVGRLFEARMLGEIVDRVAAIEKYPSLTIDEARFGGIEYYVAKTFIERVRHRKCLQQS